MDRRVTLPKCGVCQFVRKLQALTFTFPVQQMGQAAFGRPLHVYWTCQLICLSATCVFLCSCPIGLGWPICQAVCWPPLRSLQHWGPISMVLRWLICQTVPAASFSSPCWASCEQLNRSSAGLYVNFHNKVDKCILLYILCVFFLLYIFFFDSLFIALISLSSIFLSPLPSQSLNVLLVFDWRTWHAELWYVLNLVASSATCQRQDKRIQTH